MENDFSFSVFPNPASAQINISGKIFSYAELFSFDGKKILKTKYSVMNVSSIANGIYFLKITGDKKSFMQKVMLQH